MVYLNLPDPCTPFVVNFRKTQNNKLLFQFYGQKIIFPFRIVSVISKFILESLLAYSCES